MYHHRTWIKYISSFFHLRLRKCANAQKSFSAPMSLFLNGFTCNSEYRCTIETKKNVLRKNCDFFICACGTAQMSFSYFLRFFSNGFRSVFGMIMRMMCSIKFFIWSCGNMLGQMRKRVFPLYHWYLSTDLNSVFCTAFVINYIIRGGRSPPAHVQTWRGEAPPVHRLVGR